MRSCAGAGMLPRLSIVWPHNLQAQRSLSRMLPEPSASQRILETPQAKDVGVKPENGREPSGRSDTSNRLHDSIFVSADAPVYDVPMCAIHRPLQSATDNQKVHVFCIPTTVPL